MYCRGGREFLLEEAMTLFAEGDRELLSGSFRREGWLRYAVIRLFLDSYLRASSLNPASVTIRPESWAPLKLC